MNDFWNGVEGYDFSQAIIKELPELNKNLRQLIEQNRKIDDLQKEIEILKAKVNNQK